MAILLPDYDAGIVHWVGDLGFELIADNDLGGGKRWVLVAPPGAT